MLIILVISLIALLYYQLFESYNHYTWHYAQINISFSIIDGKSGQKSVYSVIQPT